MLTLNFFNMQMILRSSILKARATLLTKIYDLSKKPSNEENRYIAIWANGSCG